MTAYVILRQDPMQPDWWRPLRYEPKDHEPVGKLMTFTASNGAAAIGKAFAADEALTGVMRAIPLRNWGMAEERERRVVYRRRRLPGL